MKWLLHAETRLTKTGVSVVLASVSLLLVFRCVALAGIDTDIPETNRVVLPGGSWNPSAEETQKALVAIRSFLKGPISTNICFKPQIKNILEHTKEYRVQFRGIHRDGKKVIWYNFFPTVRNDKKDEFAQWTYHVIGGQDGGFWFWNVEYDPSTGQCMNFFVNFQT